MMKKLKKPVSILLSLLMVVSLFAIVPFAASAEGASGAYASYNVNAPDNAATIMSAINANKRPKNTTGTKLLPTLEPLQVTFNGYQWYIIEDDSTGATEGTVTLFSVSGFRADGFWGPYSDSAAKRQLDAMTADSGSFESVKDAIADTDLSDVGVTDAKLYLLSTSDIEDMLIWFFDIDLVIDPDYYSDYDYQVWLLRSVNENANDALDLVDPEDKYPGEDPYEHDGEEGLLILHPALRLDLSKVTFDSETKTFALKPAPTTYTVTWKNWNGDVLKTDAVAEGATPSYDGVTPVRPEDMNATYTFSAWDDGSTTYLIGEELPPVIGDITYTAVYTADIKKLFAGHSVSLGGDIGVNFFIDPTAADFANAETAKVVFTWDGDCSKEVDLKALDTDANGYYKATVDVVAAQMAHKIHAVVISTAQRSTKPTITAYRITPRRFAKTLRRSTARSPSCSRRWRKACSTTARWRRACLTRL